MGIVAEDMKKILAEKLPWEHLSGATILITGANGFIATYMLRALLALNDSGVLERSLYVLALVRNKERATEKFGQLLDRADITMIEHDMGLPFVWDGAIDVMIHAASQASPKYFGTDPVGTIAPNILGTHALLSLAREKKSKAFLMFSSSEIYGEVPPERIPMREDFYGFLDPLKVRSCYAGSKRMAETMCVAWADQYGIPAKIVRPFHTYGPGMMLDDGRIFADFIADICAKRNLTIKGDGLATRAFCYLGDAAAGFLHVLLKGEMGKAYNIGNDAMHVSIAELAHILVKEFAELNLAVVFQEQARHKDYIPSPVSHICPDIAQARTLGWKPETDIATGFRRVVRSFHEARTV